MADKNGDYEVGFGRPPASGRFQPGRSGNPKGRPRGRKSFYTVLHETCNEKVKIKGTDGYKYITKLKAAVTQLVNKAASGDIRSTRELIRLQQSLPDICIT